MLSTAKRITGSGVDIVAVDMPLSLEPITARRTSDDLVSVAYGARHAGTHTPSAIRPGRISDDLREAFSVLGYPLATSEAMVPALLEVYPHPALIELMSASRRLPYKHGKIRKYWPGDAIVDRKRRLVDTWSQIIASLDARITGIGLMLRIPTTEARTYELKAFEDMLDAVVCCWVGACVLDGGAVPFGDDKSAIWIPRS